MIKLRTLQIISTAFLLLAMFLASGNVALVDSVKDDVLTGESTSLSLPTENFLNSTCAIQPAIMLNFVERLRDRRRLHNISNLCFSFLFTIGTLAVVFLIKFYSALLKKTIVPKIVPNKNFVTQYKIGTQINSTVLLI